jgi:DNA-binding CsgD family transcriptional regulator/PAS domain-containing protein
MSWSPTTPQLIGQSRTKPVDRQYLLHAQDALYDALSDDSLWPEAMERLVRCFSCEKGMLHVRNGGFTAPCSLAIPAGIDGDSLQTYQEGFWKKDLWSQEADKKNINTGDVVTSESLCDKKHFLSSEFFNDFLVPQDIRYCLAGVADMSPSERVHLTVYRSLQSNEFCEQEKQAMHALLPDIRAATRATLQIEQWRSRAHIFEDALDKVTEAVVIVDAFVNVLEMNARAEKLLQAEDALCVQRGVLTSHWPCERKALHQAVRATATPGLAPQPAIVTDIHCEDSYIASPVPLRRAARARREPNRHRVPTAALFIATPRPMNSVSAGLMARMFGLTNAEVRLVENLAHGLSLPEFAGQFQVSYETARTQLKSVFEKTGVRRQTDLIAITLRLSQSGIS